MTDKIMIDGVDVSECIHRRRKEKNCTICNAYSNKVFEFDCSDFKDCYYKQLQRKEPTAEMCPYCDTEVEIPPYLGIYKCPNCGKLIVACSMCETQNCAKCEYLIEEQLQAEQQKVKELEEGLDIAKVNYSNEMDYQKMYKQALEEIKEMLEFQIEQISIYPLKPNLGKILQKCEVLND